MKTQQLFDVLCETYSLAIRTQHYHWNVVGKDFYQLHKLFESQYEEIFACIDNMAERIRALDGKVKPVANFLSEIKVMQAKTGAEMVADLLAHHEKICKVIETAMEACDTITNNMLQDRFAAHQKHVWFLKSILA